MCTRKNGVAGGRQEIWFGGLFEDGLGSDMNKTRKQTN
jgi:hypothetical protein